MPTTVLLVMDVQQGIIDRIAGDNTNIYLEKIQNTVNIAHQAALPVIYITVRFREGFPEISPSNKSFSAIKLQNMPMAETHPATQLAIQPTANDIVVTKRRVSAFSGSDLEVILRALGAKHLILCGIATSGVVLSTLREAADKDYQITVLEDGCLDADAEVHRVLCTKVFPRQAEVTSVEAWQNSLS